MGWDTVVDKEEAKLGDTIEVRPQGSRPPLPHEPTVTARKWSNVAADVERIDVPPYSEMLKDRIVPATGIGAGVGLLAGGIPGAAIGAGVGATGAAVEAGVERQLLKEGYGPAESAIAAGAGTMALEGGPGLIRAGTSAARAGRGVRRAGELADLGAMGADEVVEIARRGYQAQGKAVDAAYDAWRAGLDPDAVFSAAKVKTALSRITSGADFQKGRIGSLDALDNWEAGRPFTAQDLDNLRRGLRDDVSELQRAGRSDAARRATQAIKKIDELELELAVKYGGEEQLAALKAARAERTKLGQLERGLEGRDVNVLKQILDPATRADEPQVAVSKILQGPRPMESVRQLRQAAEAADGPEGVAALNRELRRSATQHLIGASRGATGEGLEKSAKASLNLLEANTPLYRELLGSKGYDFMVKNLKGLATKKPVSLGFREVLHMAGYAGVGGGVATADPLTAAMSAIGIGTGAVGVNFVAAKFGPHAARALAREALLDPRLYAKLTKKYGVKEGFARSNEIIAGAIRRGVFTPDDLDAMHEGAE
jgi:hypothetical protein